MTPPHVKHLPLRLLLLLIWLVVPIVGCVDTELPVGRCNHTRSDESVGESACLHYAMWVDPTETCRGGDLVWEMIAWLGGVYYPYYFLLCFEGRQSLWRRAMGRLLATGETRPSSVTKSFWDVGAGPYGPDRGIQRV